MKVIIFGATGRVGSELVRFATANGYDVTVFVRNTPATIHENTKVIYGDVRDKDAVMHALTGCYDTVFVCLGSGALKPSNLVTEGIRTILAGMKNVGTNRIIAVSGTAEMPDQTRLGRLYTALLKRTPVGHAVRDHDGAMNLIRDSGLSWVLAGCNYIANGTARGGYQTSLIFPGGFKKIKAGDVADFMLRESAELNYHQQIVGIWY